MDYPIRKIIHVDMDAFYASVEQLDHPELRGKAMAVGGTHRGVLTTASYEARKFGVRSAMPTKTALEKCPHLIVVKPRFDRYRELSGQIRNIFFEYTDKVEPLSLDEAYLDVTENKKGIPLANEVARCIRQEILEKTGLTASAGISINKFLAKVASDIHKPNGQKTIHPSQVLAFMEALPIDQFYGIGKVTAARMKRLGVFTGKDLKAKSLLELSQYFGKKGELFYQVVRGIHLSEVNPNRIRKSLAVEETYWEDLDTDEIVFDKLEELLEELYRRMEKYSIQGRCLTLKIKYADFSLFTRSRTEEHYLIHKEALRQISRFLWEQRPQQQAVRLLGLSLSSLNTEEEDRPKGGQLPLPYPDFWEEEE